MFSRFAAGRPAVAHLGDVGVIPQHNHGGYGGAHAVVLGVILGFFQYAVVRLANGFLQTRRERGRIAAEVRFHQRLQRELAGEPAAADAAHAVGDREQKALLPGHDPVLGDRDNATILVMRSFVPTSERRWVSRKLPDQWNSNSRRPPVRFGSKGSMPSSAPRVSVNGWPSRFRKRAGSRLPLAPIQVDDCSFPPVFLQPAGWVTACTIRDRALSYVSRCPALHLRHRVRRGKQRLDPIPYVVADFQIDRFQVLFELGHGRSPQNDAGHIAALEAPRNGEFGARSRPGRPQCSRIPAPSPCFPRSSTWP